MKHLKLFEEHLLEYKRKWRPSASQKREFAQNMKDLDFANDYHKRKEEKAEKRRSNSKFDYPTAGGSFIPTKIQYDFVMVNRDLFKTIEEETAANEVQMGYINNDKINHDYIHIVNDKMRRNEAINPVQLFIKDLKEKGYSDEEIERKVREFKITAPDETGKHMGFMR